MILNSCFSNCCGFGRDAIRYVDGNISFGAAAVAAFAVYSQINRSPLTSQLDASYSCFVCLSVHGSLLSPKFLPITNQNRVTLKRQLQARGVASKPAIPAARIIILTILNKIYKLLVEKSGARKIGRQGTVLGREETVLCLQLSPCLLNL